MSLLYIGQHFFFKKRSALLDDCGVYARFLYVLAQLAPCYCYAGFYATLPPCYVTISRTGDGELSSCPEFKGEHYEYK